MCYSSNFFKTQILHLHKDTENVLRNNELLELLTADDTPAEEVLPLHVGVLHLAVPSSLLSPTERNVYPKPENKLYNIGLHYRRPPPPVTSTGRPSIVLPVPGLGHLPLVPGLRVEVTPPAM